MDPPRKKCKVSKEKLKRCINWIEEQNGGLGVEPGPSVLDTEKNHEYFLETVKSEPISVPAGIDGEVDPVAVPVNRLRLDNLRLECGWKNCGTVEMDYEVFQKHVLGHMTTMTIVKDKGPDHYLCLWDSCGHTTIDYDQLLRHINYHSYHARLLAIGLNARPTYKLLRCKKDSKKRNKLPELKTKHTCMWYDCSYSFNSMPDFVAHSRLHSDEVTQLRCRWAGCGANVTRRSWLRAHIRIHTGERAVACYHCGQHFANYLKLTEHVQRQNTDKTGLVCNVCGASSGSPALLRRHEQAHIAMHACVYCDMSLPTLHTLAAHVRQRHTDSRPYACPTCEYKSKTKLDIRRHIEMHKRKEKEKRKQLKKANNEVESDTSSDSGPNSRRKKRQLKREYCCHMCSELRVYSRGSRLTTHLVQQHGIQLPFGHPRFRYQISDDGMYRLTTTRYESLEVSQKIMERQNTKRLIDGKDLEVKVTEIIEATKYHPKQIVISLLNKEEQVTDKNKENKTNFEITMCDVDEFGNIIKQKFLDSDEVVFDDTDYKNINQY